MATELKMALTFVYIKILILVAIFGPKYIILGIYIRDTGLHTFLKVKFNLDFKYVYLKNVVWRQ
jgi:hypothetical protein